MTDQGSPRLKIKLEVTQAYPALLAMLLGTSEELRGERIRMLSMIGLHAESGVAPIRSAPGPAIGNTTNEVEIPPGAAVEFAIIVNAANPRLYEALSSISPRLRAERLRVLSTLGLYVETGRVGVQSAGSREVFSSAEKSGVVSSSRPSSLLPRKASSVVTERTQEVNHTRVSPPSVSAASDAITDRSGMDETPPTVQKPPDQKPTESPASVNKVSKGVRSFARSLGK